MLRLWILFTLGSVAMGAGPLEEVLEHGPLFDELEDEAWWSGVDLVDTAATHLFQLEEQDYCGTGGEEDCSSVPLHQDHLRLPPPPPVPPALSELVKQLHLLAPSSSESSTGCLLCQWASLNGTSMDDLIPNPELSSENTWVPMLVVVALVSAMLGAVLMITALKCRRLKVLPRGGSCTTLPVGYMVGEGKEGVVHQNSELMLETQPKSSDSSSYTPSGSSVGSNHEMSRPRLCTPTIPNSMDHHHRHMKMGAASQATGWRVKLWRKMTGKSPTNAMDQSDAISAVYAELNSVSGGGSSTSGPSSIYHLNTYSEIREPCRRMMIHPQHLSRAARILNSDGTYENGAYGDRVLHLLEVDALSSNCSASTPSSAYYSDLSDRSGQQQQWVAMRQRLGSEGHHSSHSLPPPQCCGHHHIHHVPAALHCGSRTLIHHHHHARDLMPVTLQVIPDNQQYPAVALSHSNGSCTMDPNSSSQHFLRGGVSASLNGGSTKRPLPPLPSRQQQRPQRRYAYSGGVMDGGEPQDDLSCVPVPSEYV